MVKLPNGQEQRVSLESGRPVEWFSEVNYMFKLSKCKDNLNNWMESGKHLLIHFYAFIFSFLNFI